MYAKFEFNIIVPLLVQRILISRYKPTLPIKSEFWYNQTLNYYVYIMMVLIHFETKPFSN